MNNICNRTQEYFDFLGINEEDEYVDEGDIEYAEDEEDTEHMDEEDIEHPHMDDEDDEYVYPRHMHVSFIVK